MPETLRSKNISMKAVKKEVKEWVKHHVAVRGDRILWGQGLSGDMRRRKARVGGSSPSGRDGEEHRIPNSFPAQEDHAVADSSGREEREAGGEQINGTRATVFSISDLKFRGSRLCTMKRRVRKEKYKPRKRRKEIKKGRCEGHQEYKWNKKQKVSVREKSKKTRQGGHQGSVGRVKCGEG